MTFVLRPARQGGGSIVRDESEIPNNVRKVCQRFYWWRGKRTGHLCIRFGHLRLTDKDSAEKSGMVTTICPFSLDAVRRLNKVLQVGPQATSNPGIWQAREATKAGRALARSLGRKRDTTGTRASPTLTHPLHR